MQKTFSAKQTDVERNWYIVSAGAEPLGRLAARVAATLRGKHKPIFTPHVDCGDFVIVTDAESASPLARTLATLRSCSAPSAKSSSPGL